MTDANRIDADGLLPAERRIVEELGHLPLDFRAMWAVSNLFRSSTAIRRRMEAKVLAADRLSWTSFVGLWVLWVWGEMEARDFVTRRKDARDGRMVIVELTPSGRMTIEGLFPKFNAEEASVVSHLSADQQDSLAAMLRSLLRAVAPADGTPVV